MLTVPYEHFTPYLPPNCTWIKGQLEVGDGGFRHWQILVGFDKKTSLAGARDTFGPFHSELSRSEAASAYVWKDETCVPGTRFELGAKPIRRNAKIDWESVWIAAVAGDLSAVPANIRVVSYRTLRAIAADNDRPIAMLRLCYVFWGATGTGKSRRAWEEAGINAYSKDPRSKFWCGYQAETNVVIDEFRGGIDISHILRWLDRYPVRVEIKGSSKPLTAEKIWITSNLNPSDWYPDADAETVAALRRRLNITQFH